MSGSTSPSPGEPPIDSIRVVAVERGRVEPTNDAGRVDSLIDGQPQKYCFTIQSNSLLVSAEVVAVDAVEAEVAVMGFEAEDAAGHRDVPRLVVSVSRCSIRPEWSVALGEEASVAAETQLRQLEQHGPLPVAGLGGPFRSTLSIRTEMIPPVASESSFWGTQETPVGGWSCPLGLAPDRSRLVLLPVGAAQRRPRIASLPPVSTGGRWRRLSSRT